MPATIPERGAPGASLSRAAPPGPVRDRVVVAAFMAVYVASAVFGGSGYDSARDVAAAFAIRHAQAFALHGPLLGGALHLGPAWFYLLALPLVIADSWVAVALFVALICSLQYPLAYAAGTRLLDRRLGLLWCALLALPGWGTFQLIGFAHTNAVPVTVMLVIYALVRLAQERRPQWLVLAVTGQMLALHAHPATLPLALAVAIVAIHALRDRALLLRWGMLSLALAALLLLPLAVEHFTAPAASLERPGEYLASMVRIANLGTLGALLAGVFVRGPQFVADAFFAFASGMPEAVRLTVLALESLALAGVLATPRGERRLAVIGIASILVGAATIALARPATPFYMIYALVPLAAGTAALGLHRLCALSGTRGPAAAGALIAVLLALHVASVGAIARAIVSGRIVMSGATRLDVKFADPRPPDGETWLPAYAVGISGRLLCAQPNTVVLHGLYAYLEDTYFGLDHRLACGAHDVRLLGAAPVSSAAHFVGLSKPLWAALDRQPAAWIGGMGIAPAASVIAPPEGHAVPDGLTYPPYAIPEGPARRTPLDATLEGDAVLVVSFPFRTWAAEPEVTVTADGKVVAPLARDMVSVLYACTSCAAKAQVAWHIEFASAAPEWVDVVSLKPAH